MHLTAKQSKQINTSKYTHNYLAEYRKDQHGDADHAEYYTEQFEADTGVLTRSCANDVGGLIIYMNGKQLVAYYDYENLGGCVFV